ncbi:MAG: cellulose synthase catalytic subunit [Candidatus Limnocylindria bacterium]
MSSTTRRHGHLPPPDSPTRLVATRVVAVAALIVSAAYLGWRATATLNIDAWYLSLPMFVFEVHAAIGLGLFTFSLWDVDVRPRRRELGRVPTIAVLIPTYNEGPEILVPTIAAAVALEPAHETWVLDDGERPEIAELAAALGARYLARTTHEHAKAGNLNHALGVVDTEILAVLDADHVAAPEFLRATLGYFADPQVALVQTPQDFYNVTSFEHGSGVAYGEPFHEQTLFYRLLQPGKNRWSAAFWCGTNALVRTEALRSIGGAATETITEDIHTTIRFHRAGWRTVYHNAPLVLVSGQIPIVADGLTFAVAFGVTYGMQQAALFLLGRGAYRPIVSIVFDLVRMSPNFLATMTLFTSRIPRFEVTPKGRIAANRGRVDAPFLLRASLGVSVIGAAGYVLHLLGIRAIGYASEWAAAGAFFWLVVNAGLAWIAMRRVRSLRFAAERRNAVRFAVDIAGAVDGEITAIQGRVSGWGAGCDDGAARRA